MSDGAIRMNNVVVDCPKRCNHIDKLNGETVADASLTVRFPVSLSQRAHRSMRRAINRRSSSSRTLSLLFPTRDADFVRNFRHSTPLCLKAVSVCLSVSSASELHGLCFTWKVSALVISFAAAQEEHTDTIHFARVQLTWLKATLASTPSLLSTFTYRYRLSVIGIGD